MQSALDKAVSEASHQFVAELSKLNSEPYLREAIMKMAIRDVAWAMLHTFGDKHELADQLEGMAEVIRNAKDDEDEEDD